MPLNAEVFTQHIGWTAKDYATLHATFGIAGKLVGAVGAVASASTVGAFAATSGLWAHASYPLELYIFALEASLAVTSVAFLTLSMNLAWTVAAATQFTVYMTVTNIGRTIAPLLAGLGLSHGAAFGLAALLARAPVALLPLVGDRRTDDVPEGGSAPRGDVLGKAEPVAA